MTENERRAGTIADALVASSVDGLAAIDREYRYTLWNPAMERYTRKRADEVLGRNILDVFPFLREVGLDRAMERALAGEEVTIEAVEHVEPDGSMRWFDRHYGPLRSSDGEVIGAVAVVHEVTDRRRVEAVLRDREELFRSVVENASEAIGIVDSSGRALYVNPALDAILGYAPGDLSGETIVRLAHPEDLARAAAGLMRNVTDVGSCVDLEARWRHKDGSWRTLDGRSRSYRASDGQVHVVLIARDVTEEKRTRETLRDTEERLRASRKMEALGRLAGGVAHDFNNLLTVILGAIDLLARAVPPSPATTQPISDVKRAAERGAALTRQLLTLSRKQPLQTKVLAIDAIVSDLDAMLRRLIGEHVELATRLEAGSAGRVKADAGQIEQVVLNLVLNARDAVGDRGGHVEIATSIVRVGVGERDLSPGEYVSIRVKDDGCGMTDEVKAHLFEPFFTTKPRGQGTGLGLATVYGVVKQARGDVTIASAPGEGTSFEVLLPLVQAEIEPRASAAPTQAPRGSETVLLVEDEAPLRRLIRDVLTASGYAVLEAANGDEALRTCDERAARDERVDLVLSDVVMPGMSGRQLAKSVRRRWPGARVLLMSGYDDDAATGGDELMLGKPFTATTLTQRVREALDARAFGEAR